MKLKTIPCLILMLIFFYARPALCQNASSLIKARAEKTHISLEDILKNVEKRYTASGFSTRFYQTLTLKAMDITDTATGRAFFKRPGMMRWEYERPDRQIIITDSDTLWIYRPEDSQVMVGKSPSFFAGGKGASFLSDMKLIRQKFDISLQEKSEGGYHVLKLLPKEKTLDVSVIYISISAKNFHVARITTHNSYGDETVIELSNTQFKPELDDSMFIFQIPQGVEVLQLDE
jgi:outer membrane lipoprotein carrier protein